MWVPGPTEPMTPEGWKVLGCLVSGVGLCLAGLGLYGCIKTGFGNSFAVTVLLGGVLIAAAPVAVWYLVRWWVG